VLGIDPLAVIEGDSGTVPAVFTVTLSAPSDQEITVDFYTSTGHVNDIITSTGTLRFLPGVTSQTITVQVVGDLIDESVEAFNVHLTNSPNAYIVSGAGYCYIQDNDPTPTLTISDVRKKEGRSGTTLFVFTVTLSAPSAAPVTVHYATSDGTARAGEDYTAAFGTLTFAPGQKSKTITVAVKGERLLEADETFSVNLSGATDADILDGQGLGTILNDD
jgi:large repetitive protein